MSFVAFIRNFLSRVGKLVSGHPPVRIAGEHLKSKNEFFWHLALLQ